MNNSQNRGMVILLVVLGVGAIAWAALTMPDRRTTGEKIGDAVDKATRELEDRTPGEKLGDAVKDAGENIKRNTDQ